MHTSVTPPDTEALLLDRKRFTSKSRYNRLFHSRSVVLVPRWSVTVILLGLQRSVKLSFEQLLLYCCLLLRDSCSNVVVAIVDQSNSPPPETRWPRYLGGDDGPPHCIVSLLYHDVPTTERFWPLMAVRRLNYQALVRWCLTRRELVIVSDRGTAYDPVKLR